MENGTQFKRRKVCIILILIDNAPLVPYEGNLYDESMIERTSLLLMDDFCTIG